MSEINCLCMGSPTLIVTSLNFYHFFYFAIAIIQTGALTIGRNSISRSTSQGTSFGNRTDDNSERFVEMLFRGLRRTCFGFNHGLKVVHLLMMLSREDDSSS